MSNTWSATELATLTAPQEVHVVTHRADGTPRSPRIIWIVRADNRAFIRSTNGRTAAWFRNALNGSGRIDAAGHRYDVTFTDVTDEHDLELVDDAYRHKYNRYASIVDHLQETGPRTATLELTPGHS